MRELQPGRSVPRGVKRKMSNFPLRPRKPRRRSYPSTWCSGVATSPSGDLRVVELEHEKHP